MPLSCFLPVMSKNSFRQPQGITVVSLSQEHRSIPVNPILACPVYLAGYIEQLGTGTTDLIKRCQDLGLRRPEFRQDENFLSILWRKNAGKDDATGHKTGHEKTTIRRIVMAIGVQTLTLNFIPAPLNAATKLIT